MNLLAKFFTLCKSSKSISQISTLFVCPLEELIYSNNLFPFSLLRAGKINRFGLNLDKILAISLPMP
jgi:hypothetical protein